MAGLAARLVLYSGYLPLVRTLGICLPSESDGADATAWFGMLLDSVLPQKCLGFTFADCIRGIEIGGLTIRLGEIY